MARWSGPIQMQEVPDELLREDENGELRVTRRKPARKNADGDLGIAETAVRRGVIRFLVLVVDCSENMNQRDMRPTRLQCAHQVVLDFIENYFDQNPISQLALIQLREGKAEKITELSGNQRHHKSKLDEYMAKQKYLGHGPASLRAGLELASSQLEMQASYGVREVLILYGSLSTSDRGDIFKTVEKLQDKKIKVSVVGVGAELYVAKAMCEKTGGKYSVATEANKMRSKVLEMTTPPPVYETPGAREKPAAGMWVGFPEKTAAPVAGWKCPRCHDIVADGSLPTDCGVCGLKLLHSAHLARSFHHLFPVPEFTEVVEGACEEGGGGDGGKTAAVGGGDGHTKAECRACGVLVDDAAESRFECPRCSSQYCALCDSFIHEILHVCPGCENRTGGKATLEARAEGGAGGGAGGGGNGGDVVMGEG